MDVFAHEDQHAAEGMAEAVGGKAPFPHQHTVEVELRILTGKEGRHEAVPDKGAEAVPVYGVGHGAAAAVHEQGAVTAVEAMGAQVLKVPCVDLEEEGVERRVDVLEPWPLYGAGGDQVPPEDVLLPDVQDDGAEHIPFVGEEDARPQGRGLLAEVQHLPFPEPRQRLGGKGQGDVRRVMEGELQQEDEGLPGKVPEARCGP